ncbi:MAG: ATP synthase F1 subunit epsilon [Polyangiaceae bacterium]
MAELNRILLEVVTQEGVALRKSVDELTAPSVDGDFGVLPGHRPLLAALRTGLVSYRVGNEEVRVAVGPGFAQVNHENVVLLTDKFCRKSDIDVVAVRLELLEADEALDGFSGELGGPEHGLLIRRSRWAAARLELYGDPPPPTVHTYAEFQTVAHPDYLTLKDPGADQDEGVN